MGEFEIKYDNMSKNAILEVSKNQEVDDSMLKYSIKDNHKTNVSMNNSKMYNNNISFHNIKSANKSINNENK